MTGQSMKPGTKLGDDYQEKTLPVAKQRLYQAGGAICINTQRGVSNELKET